MSAIRCAEGLLVDVQNESAARFKNTEKFLCSCQKPVDVLARLDPAIRPCTTVRVRRRCDYQVEKSVRIFTKDFSALSRSDFTFRLRHASEFMRGIVRTRVRFFENSELVADHGSSSRRPARASSRTSSNTRRN